MVEGANNGGEKNMMFRIAAIAAISLAASGCASIVNEASVPMRVETVSETGVEVKGAECALENERGKVTVTTPGSVAVRRSSQDLQITCAKAGSPDARGISISRANAGLAGNILFGGGIGAIIDHNKGTAYTYAPWLRLVMGKELVFDRRDDKEGQPNLGGPVGGQAKTVQTTQK